MFRGILVFILVFSLAVPVVSAQEAPDPKVVRELARIDDIRKAYGWNGYSYRGPPPGFYLEQFRVVRSAVGTSLRDLWAYSRQVPQFLYVPVAGGLTTATQIVIGGSFLAVFGICSGVCLAGGVVFSGDEGPDKARKVEIIRELIEEGKKYGKEFGEPEEIERKPECGGDIINPILARVTNINPESKTVELADAYIELPFRLQIPLEGILADLAFIPQVGQFLVVQAEVHTRESPKKPPCLTFEHSPREVIDRAKTSPNTLTKQDWRLIEELRTAGESARFSAFRPLARSAKPSKSWLNSPRLENPTTHPSGISPLLHVLAD